jgi:hypothetical protein
MALDGVDEDETCQSSTAANCPWHGAGTFAVHRRLADLRYAPTLCASAGKCRRRDSKPKRASSYDIRTIACSTPEVNSSLLRGRLQRTATEQLASLVHVAAQALR